MFLNLILLGGHSFKRLAKQELFLHHQCVRLCFTLSVMLLFVFAYKLVTSTIVIYNIGNLKHGPIDRGPGQILQSFSENQNAKLPN